MNNNKGCLFALFTIFLKLISPKTQKHLKKYHKENQKKHNSTPLPYEPRKWILSKAELSFFHCLQNAISPEEHIIFTKVRLEDIIKVKKDTNSSEYNAARNRIKSKHIDFVICDAKTSEIQRLIELNDQSHKNTDRIERDNFIKEISEITGNDLITINAQRTYNIEEIRNILTKHTN